MYPFGSTPSSVPPAGPYHHPARMHPYAFSGPSPHHHHQHHQHHNNNQHHHHSNYPHQFHQNQYPTSYQRGGKIYNRGGGMNHHRGGGGGGGGGRGHFNNHSSRGNHRGGRGGHNSWSSRHSVQSSSWFTLTCLDDPWFALMTPTERESVLYNSARAPGRPMHEDQPLTNSSQTGSEQTTVDQEINIDSEEEEEEEEQQLWREDTVKGEHEAADIFEDKPSDQTSTSAQSEQAISSTHQALSLPPPSHSQTDVQTVSGPPASKSKLSFKLPPPKHS